MKSANNVSILNVCMHDFLSLPFRNVFLQQKIKLHLLRLILQPHTLLTATQFKEQYYILAVNHH